MHRSDVEGGKNPTFPNSGTEYIMSGGKVIFPIGMYNVPQDQLQVVKDVGFNTVQSYEAQPSILTPYMTELELLGLKAILTICNNDQPCSDSNIKYSATLFKDSPSMLSWYISDEPGLSGVLSDDLIHIDGVIASVSDVPTSIVLSYPQYYEEYKDASDIFMIDPYPIKPTREILEVADWVDLARFETNDSKPVIAVLQAFEGWSWPRLPTKEEVRVMSYIAVIHGAKGLMYYTYHSDDGFSMTENPSFWGELSVIATELNANIPMFLSLDHATKAVSSDKRIHVLAKDVSGIRKVMAANSANEQVIATIDGVDMTFAAYEVKIL